ncbi:MAG: FAD-dependent oxidoreductase [Rhodocyclaceae bacterium]
MLEDTNGASRSVWMNVSVPDFPPLQTEIGTDACVIGAGVAGLSSAYLLAQAGKQVVLLDSLGIGAGETGRTTATRSPSGLRPPTARCGRNGSSLPPIRLSTTVW